jgi:hypothetical protein
MGGQILAGWTAYLEMLGTGVALILTLCVFSYLLGDNVLFRLAEHIFVGVAVGYAAVVIFHSVLVPKLLQPLIQALGAGDWGRLQPLLFPLFLGLLLLIKPLSRAKGVSWLGNFGVALLLGVGAALAIQGALFGTLVPQVGATADILRYVDGHQPGMAAGRYGPVLGVLSGVIVLVGTTGVLLHFSFRSDRRKEGLGLPARLVGAWGGLGRWLVFVAFGAILATTFVSRLSLLVGRLQFVLEAVRSLVGVQ